MKEYLFVTRLNKYLSEIGYCSRREADKLIDGHFDGGQIDDGECEG